MLALILASQAFAPPACAAVRDGTSRAAVHMQFKMPEMPGGLPKFQMPKLGIDMPGIEVFEGAKAKGGKLKSMREGDVRFTDADGDVITITRGMCAADPHAMPRIARAL